MSGYLADPPDTFRMGITYKIFQSSGATTDGSMQVDIPAGTSPYAVYAEVLQNLVAAVAQLGETVSKHDVFCYVPTPFSVLIPDTPSFT
jgi:hypothetical protein